MAQPTAVPALTPQFCFNERALRDFLRLSRASLDDTISIQLNALVTPSTSNPFYPNATSTRTPTPSTRPIPPSSCDAFKRQVLLPSWHARSTVLDYCSNVASSSSSTDQTPMPNPNADNPTVLQSTNAAISAEADAKIVDERLDPYSGRVHPSTIEPPGQKLERMVRTEARIERIVRSRTWAVLRDRCGDADTADDDISGRGGEVRDRFGSTIARAVGAVGGGRKEEGWEVALERWRREELESTRQRG